MSGVNELDDIDGSMPLAPAKAASILLYVLVGLVAVAFVWAATAKLDQVTRGEGRVVPSSLLQEVQYLEGGMVKEIRVRAGDAVKRGDVLVRLDPTQINAEFLQGRDGFHLLAARIARLEALANDTPLAFPAEVEKSAPQAAADERQLYEAKRAEFAAAIAVEQGKHDEAKAALANAEEALALAREELRIIGPLVARGLEPRIELLRARQRAVTAEGAHQAASALIQRTQTELRQKQSAILSATSDELARAKAEMAGIAGDLPALRDKIDRTELRAPIDGVVNRVLVSTIGGVVKPGDTVVEVVPVGETPLVEARIRPADIGFIRLGQKARVKLTAYDSAIYGTLDGLIETISPDAIEDEKTGERYFLVLVRTGETALDSKRGRLPIQTGMAAEVDILNGKRTVLAYLFKPVVDVSGRAFREQ